ncbi:MAG: hypothetical protein HRU16_06145, partial [Planctomycetes bacterium]|nr:hypothetical protein [Planctomycetota bacterium]
MKRIYKVLGRDQESRSLFSANLALICFFFGLLLALLVIPSSGDAESVAVSPGSVEFAVGQDPDPDSNQQREVDDD